MRIVQNLRRDPADIIHSVHFYTNLYAAVAARLSKIREIGAIRSNFHFDINSNGAIGRLQLKAPRHLITNSATARDRAIASGIRENRVHLLPNVVAVPEAGANGRTTNGTKQILFVGRLTEEKRADRFLRVVSKIVTRTDNIKVRAVIAGDGPLKSRLEGLARSIGLTNGQLEFLGECADMRPVYRKSDLLMLTSDLEGMPNVLLEAMAEGLPVAATRVGGVPEIVAPDRGFLCERNDEDGLAVAGLKLISDAHLRHTMGENGRKYVSNSHSAEQLSGRLIGIYKEVLHK